MFHHMQRHHRPILWVLLIVIVVSFGIGGTWSLLSRQKPGTNDEIVMKVGDIPITAQAFRAQLNQALRQRNARGGEATYEDLVMDGTVDEILLAMGRNALFQLEVADNPLALDKKALITQLQNMFKDEDGNVDAARYNQWVQSRNDGGENWTKFYEMLGKDMSQMMLRQEVLASARLLESDIKQQFAEMFTEMQVKYAAVEPKVEPTEADIQKQYDDNPDRYQRPEARDVIFVKTSLKPNRPALVDELVERARGGEDFAELAKQYSDGPQKEQGGDLSWMPEQENPMPIRAPLFKLAVGEVSDAVEGYNNDYYIYKIEEERTNETSGKREVKARVIQINATLSEAERDAIMTQAEAFAAEVVEDGDLKADAEAAGLPVYEADGVSAESREIADVDPADMFSFRQGISEVAEGEVSDVITASKNLYLAKVTGITPAELKPFDEVREQVERDVVPALKRTDEYKERAEALCNQIIAEATSLDDAVTKFPDLELKVTETKPFTARTFRYEQGFFVDPVGLYNTLKDVKLGALAGPISDLMGRNLVVELVSFTKPEDQEDTDDSVDEEKENLRKSLLAQARQKRFNDYEEYLSKTMNVPIMRAPDTIGAILGIEVAEKEMAPTDSQDAAPAESSDTAE